MTQPDCRALCAELIKIVEEHCNPDEYALCDVVDTLNRARAALATPPPEDNTKPGFINVCVEGPPPAPYENWEDWLVCTFKNRTIQRVYIRALISGDFSFDKKEVATPPPEPLRPIPVSERLPEPGDCALWPGEPEATPWCWAGKHIDDGWEWAQISMLGLSAPHLRRVIAGGGWSHWLPYNAIPFPKVTQ